MASETPPYITSPSRTSRDFVCLFSPCPVSASEAIEPAILVGPSGVRNSGFFRDTSRLPRILEGMVNLASGHGWKWILVSAAVLVMGCSSGDDDNQDEKGPTC